MSEPWSQIIDPIDSESVGGASVGGANFGEPLPNSGDDDKLDLSAIESRGRNSIDLSHCLPKDEPPFFRTHQVTDSTSTAASFNSYGSLGSWDPSFMGHGGFHSRTASGFSPPPLTDASTASYEPFITPVKSELPFVPPAPVNHFLWEDPFPMSNSLFKGESHSPVAHHHSRTPSFPVRPSTGMDLHSFHRGFSSGAVPRASFTGSVAGSLPGSLAGSLPGSERFSGSSDDSEWRLMSPLSSLRNPPLATDADEDDKDISWEKKFPLISQASSMHRGVKPRGGDSSDRNPHLNEDLEVFLWRHSTDQLIAVSPEDVPRLEKAMAQRSYKNNGDDAPIIDLGKAGSCEIVAFPPASYKRVYIGGLEIPPSDCHTRRGNDWVRGQECLSECRFRTSHKRPSTIRHHFLHCRTRNRLRVDPIRHLCQLQLESLVRFKHLAARRSHQPRIRDQTPSRVRARSQPRYENRARPRPRLRADTPSDRVDTPSDRVDTPNDHANTPSDHADTSSDHADTSSDDDE